MKNIVLVMVTAGSQGEVDKAHIPLGLLYVGSALDRNQYNVTILHVLPNEFEQVLSTVKEKIPLWIGVSVLSGMTTEIATDLSVLIKENFKEQFIVWGGHHPSAEIMQCLKEDYIDAIIVGEGEDTSVELSEALEGKRDFKTIDGLCFKENEKPVINKQRALENEVDRFDINWELIDLNQYKRVNSYGKYPVSFYSSRGCPYKCQFCSTPTYTGKSVRTHSIEFVIRHLEYLNKEYGFNSVFFSDDNFLIDRKRGLEIIKRLSEIGISVDTLDVRLNQINENVLIELKKYGANGIFFGYESGNDRLLELIKKGITLDKMKEKVKLIKKYNIRCWASGIIGLPTETKEEFYSTIDFSMWLRDNLPTGSVVSTYRYMPLPSTNLLFLLEQQGYKKPSKARNWSEIDPIGNYYKMPWVKWSSKKDFEFFEFVQDVGRLNLLTYRNDLGLIPSKVINSIVKYLRSKIAKRETPSENILKFIFFLRNTYMNMRGGVSMKKVERGE